jgi:hypothetical protein
VGGKQASLKFQRAPHALEMAQGGSFGSDQPGSSGRAASPGFSVDVIPSAIEYVEQDEAYVNHLRQRWNPQGLHVLGTMAALTAEKDPLTLIRAVHACISVVRTLCFCIFGAPGSESLAHRN